MYMSVSIQEKKRKTLAVFQTEEILYSNWLKIVSEPKGEGKFTPK